MRTHMALRAVLGAVVICACGAQPTTTATPAQFPPAGPYEEIPGGKAELYVFNASGWTLIQSNYTVKDSGQRIASLPRGTYKRLLIEPGAHELNAVERSVKFEALERYRYYFVVAYSPEKSWAFPFAGSPMFVGFVPEEKGRELLTQSTEVQEE
jgi:hypothetical protein